MPPSTGPPARRHSAHWAVDPRTAVNAAIVQEAKERDPGKDHDTESNLDYFYARYYSETLGRFMTPDWADAPAAVPYAAYSDPQSLNLYAYVQNNPLTGIDADGHVGQPPTYSYQNQELAEEAAGQQYTVEADPVSEGAVSLGDGTPPPDAPGDDGPQLPGWQRFECICSGGFWSQLGHGFKNLLHGHSWNYIKATVTTIQRDLYVIGTSRGTVTAATDAVGVAAAASGNTALGMVNGGVSVANDHGPVNVGLTLFGAFPETAIPAAGLAANIDIDTLELKTALTGMFDAIPKEEGNPVDMHDQEVQIPDTTQGLGGELPQ